MSVGVKVNGNLEKALSKFKRKVKSSKILFHYKEKQQYTKPSKKRRNAKHKSDQRMWDSVLSTPGALDERSKPYEEYVKEIRKR